MRLSVRQGSVDRAAFSLPAALAEARVTGGDVRETRSRLEGDRRVYEVQFQNDVYDRVEWTVDVELPNPGEAALPAIAFPDAQMTAGYVLTDNASEYEMKLKTAGVDPAPLAEIPFLPALTKSAGVHRAPRGWSVVVGLERLEKAASRAAFVAWAEITTALRHDGTEWHRASYRLQNRSLQFLPVRLPAGAELLSARVAGQSVRADAGKVGGAEAILIPLIKTKPGDLAYDVELIYRTHGGTLGWLESRRFDDPDLVGITVERTIWNVWLPNDRHLWKAGGNVEPVLAEVNRTEKLEGMLQEAKALSVMCLSPLTSIAVRKSASENFYRLKKSIEEISQQDAEYDLPLPASTMAPKPTPGEENVGKKGVKAQQAWVSEKRKEINDALSKETEQVRSVDWSGQVTNGQVQQQQQQLNTSDFFLNNAPVQQQAQQNIQGIGANTNTALAPGERWDYNKDFKTAQPSTPTPAPAQPGNNLYLNDNVVLLQKQVPAPQKPASGVPAEMAGRMGGTAKGRGDKAEVDKLEELSALKNAPDWDRGISKHADGTMELGLQSRDTKLETKAQDERVLNTARGNVAFQQVQEFQSQAGAISTLRPQTAAPALPAAVTTPAPAGPSQNFTGGVGGGAGQSTRFASGGVFFDTPGLQPQGRISLDVDFPTEGQVLHFKKVKSNAQIELRIVEPDAFTRWKWLALALGLGLVVWALAAWCERRARRRLVVAMERTSAVA